MKGWKKLLLGSCIVLVLLALPVWFLPARWVAPWLEPRLRGVQLRDVGGLLWNGHADEVISADGIALGRLQWQLSRRALIGATHLSFQLDGPVANAAGTLDGSDGDSRWHDVDLHLHLDAMPHPVVTSLGEPHGEVAVRIDQAELRAGWPMRLAGSAHWRQASVRIGSNTLALGDLQLDAAGANGVTNGQLLDDGQGPLSVRGSLQVSPLGWRVVARLQARSPDPSLRRWLARLGPADAQGVVHIQRAAGLGATPVPGVSR